MWMQYMYPFCNCYIICAGHKDCLGGNRQGQLTATCGMFVRTSVGTLHLNWCCFCQLGTFRSSEGEYFVEPLHSYNGEHYEEEHIKPHIVYRKDAHKKAKEDTLSCDAAGKKVTFKFSLLRAFFLFFLFFLRMYYLSEDNTHWVSTSMLDILQESC